MTKAVGKLKSNSSPGPGGDTGSTVTGSFQDLKNVLADIEGPLCKVYQMIEGPLCKVYQMIEGPLCKVYQMIEGPLCKVYQMIEGPLCKVYQMSLSGGNFRRLEGRFILPLHKKGNKQCKSNYRRVSLTTVTCKVLERFIRYCY